MNICFISYGHISVTRGGIDRVTATLANSLQLMGHQITMLSIQNPLDNDKIETYQYFFPSQDAASEKNRRFLKTFIKEHNIDTIIYQSENMALFKLLVMDDNKVSIIAAIHTDPLAALKGIRDTWDLWKYKQNLLFFYLKLPYFILRLMYQIYNRKKYSGFKYRYFYQHSSALVLLSEKFKTPFSKLTKINNTNKLYAIGNPLSYTADQCQPISKEKIILFVGRLEFSPKRLDRLVKIWARIKNKKDWKIQVLGDGKDKAFYESICTKYNVHNIEFLGRVDPLPYYQKASILCITSTHEGFCMVATEALQNEVIPIAFDSYEAVWDIIQNGHNGYIVKSFSLNKYRNILEKLINSPQLRNQIRNNIRIQNMGLHKFNAKQISNEWHKLIQDVTDL